MSSGLRKTRRSCLFSSPECVARPLVTAQEDSTTDGNPHGPRPNTLEEGPCSLLPPYLAHQVRHSHPLPCKHHSRFEHIQRRCRASSHGARECTKRRALDSGSLCPPVSAGNQPFQPLPQRELDDCERHLAHNGDAPPPVQLPPHGGEPVRCP